jgi:hypothetical protein
VSYCRVPKRNFYRAPGDDFAKILMYNICIDEALDSFKGNAYVYSFVVDDVFKPFFLKTFPCLFY